jgi:radical SAM/Cys-rich protein
MFGSYVAVWKFVRPKQQLAHLKCPQFKVLVQYGTKSSESEEIVAKREIRKSQERQQWFVQATNSLPSFAKVLSDHNLYPLKRKSLKVLQVNLGKLCNMTCHHCHVESGPTKIRENMNKDTVERVIQLMHNTPQIETVDLTGGAPEMNPHFKYFVEQASAANKLVIDRCNLTIFYEPGYEWLPEYLAQYRVQVIASLPCYTVENVEKQRGKGVFDKSIKALQWLNKLGYGKDPKLELHLVYNPGGAFLPAPQKQLEEDYKRELKKFGDIEFNRLFTITNMPIKRFADFLYNTGQYKEYMTLLVNSFNKATVDHLMCLDQVSVGWDGTLYDCDFNQMLEINIGASPNHSKMTVWDVNSFEELVNKNIAVKNHCFGCTAGAGSSCGGALV